MPHDTDLTQTDRDLIEAWRFDVTGPISPPIVAEYRRYLTEYAASTGSLVAATPFTLRRFVADRTDRWGPSTQQIVRRSFRSFYKWAAQQGAIDSDPALPLPPIKAPEVPVRSAGPDIQAKLLAAAMTDRDRAILSLLFSTGARRGEIAALRVQDVDMAIGTLSIAKSKTGKPRVVPIAKPGREALTIWLAERAVQAPPHDRLWTVSNGKPLTAAGLKTRLRRIATRADVDYSSHDSRRAFAEGWLEKGGSETSLMAIAGWTSPSMIARYVRSNRERIAFDEARRLLG